MIMKTTQRAINKFTNACNAWITRQKSDDTKYHDAIRSVAERAQVIAKEIEKKTRKLAIKFCTDDKDGQIMRDQFGFKFTKANQELFDEAMEKLMDEEYELEPEVAFSTPKDLTKAERDAIAGFIVVEHKETELKAV